MSRFAALLATVATVASCLPPRDAQRPAAPVEKSDAETQELIERVARLELGIRRHRELAAKQQRSMSAELEKILAGVARLATPAAKVEPRRQLLADVVYSVPIDGSPSVGPKFAPVTIVVANDFTCPFCETLFGTLETLRGEFPKELKVVYASLIIDATLGRNSALAHCAASRQGLGETIRAEIWREHRAGHSRGDLAERFSPAKLAELAELFGAKRRQYDRDVAGDCVTQIEAEGARFDKLGLDGAPAVFINGRFISGPQRIDTFRNLVSAELVRAKRAFATGIKARDYYRFLVATGSEGATEIP